MYNDLIMKFARAIHQTNIIQLAFRTKDQRILTRTCAPLDIALSSRANVKQYKFHFWDFDSMPKPHILSISPEQIVAIEVLDKQFQPETIVTWVQKAPWTIARDW